MRLGNDIVDLLATSGHHPRFAERILHADELARSNRWMADEPLLWMYWAAKEAAYKAIKQNADIPFHQREFLVAADFSAVSYQNEILNLAIETRSDCVFALCTDGSLQHSRSQIHTFPSEPSLAEQSAWARKLLLTLAASALALPFEALEISTFQRIPKILYGQKILPYPVSLTHHGRQVAASMAVMTSPGL